MTVEINSSKQTCQAFNEDLLVTAKKLLNNQIRTQGSKHHESEGTIYSIGFAAKYDALDDNMRSFSKFVTSKWIEHNIFNKFFILQFLIFQFLNNHIKICEEHQKKENK